MRIAKDMYVDPEFRYQLDSYVDSIGDNKEVTEERIEDHRLYNGKNSIGFFSLLVPKERYEAYREEMNRAEREYETRCNRAIVEAFKD
jgi:hypothetical protein